MFKASIMFVLLLAGIALPQPSNAQSTTALSLDAVREWPAIGRLMMPENTPGYTCGGTLIAPDIVLTAAHCVSRFNNKGPSIVRQLIFRAGWHPDDGGPSARAKRIEFHPYYTPGSGIRLSLPHDFAAVHLVTPITQVAPVALGDIPDPLAFVSFIVYSGKAPKGPNLSENCSQSRMNPKVLQVGCPVIGGNSGGGILSGTGRDAQLIGVISASSGGRALGPILDDWVKSLVVE